MSTKLKVTVHVEGTPSEIAAQLLDHVAIYNKSPDSAAKADKAKAAKAEPADDDAEEDEDFGAKKSSTKKASKFEEESEDADEEEGFNKPAAKTKAKKLTADDVNDAAKALAKSIGGKEGREKVLGILKKKFKTTSVTELKPEQYEAAIEALAVEE